MKDTDVEKWRALLTARYFGLFGDHKDAHIQMLRKLDPGGIVLEEKQMISSVGEINLSKQLTISVYRTTSRIVIQGTRKDDWIQKELPSFKEVVEESTNAVHAVELFEKKLNFSTPDMNKIMHDAEIDALKKCAEKNIALAENDEENYVVEDNIPT